ncbi:hypothetical protein COCOR_06834 [Corallococcus coralloides DSM 2259]|uniref:Uncharacterized protein n=1 Tax=Corallococcus coralloides (strain ATCC 25202 / DSM 2259 / NBRC 100086 / M2) TaxID=1144275 RepID=H8N0X9_CORCM|nr:hypothetical protein [Corallococcus coralloides]AFE07157.1 hypothetical protein COCOR_06834 [Corallococcus coralloides DSM 2259]
MPLQVLTQFNAFPLDAQKAFLAAVEVWSETLDSTVPVRINAFFGTPLQGLNGLCIPNAVQDTQFLARDTWYASALADKLRNKDLQEGQPDLEIHFAKDDWNLDLDLEPRSGQSDLMTVALHELCHGLGFVTLFAEDATNTQGSCGNTALIQKALPGLPLTFKLPDFNSRPGLCDRQLQNDQGQALTDTTLFANPSEALATQLTSGAVFFEGPSQLHYKFYAPKPFAFATSLMHFDPAEQPDSLMAPSVGKEETIHQPDEASVNILKDLGW